VEGQPKATIYRKLRVIPVALVNASFGPPGCRERKSASHSFDFRPLAFNGHKISHEGVAGVLRAQERAVRADSEQLRAGRVCLLDALDFPTR
jgi:hypothetical protein